MLLTKAYLLFKLLGPIKDYLLVLPEKNCCKAALYCVLIAKTIRFYCWQVWKLKLGDTFINTLIILVLLGLLHLTGQI